MTVDELYNNISRGGELEFEYLGKKYSITHSEEGIHVMEQYNYDSECVCSKLEEVGEYIIGEKSLKEIIDKVNIIFRCFE